MAKATDAFRTIGEVSEELDVPKHVLRFWEGKFPQLKPMKRGGGRRFYRPEDVALLRGIHHHLHSAGYTIKGVQRILREDGIDAVKNAANVEAINTGPEVPQADAAPGPVAKKRGKRSEAGAVAPLTPSLRAHLTDLVRELEDCLAIGRDSASHARSAPRGPAAKANRS